MSLHHHKPAAYADPLHAGRHPFQTYMLTVCVISGIPLAANRPAARSIAETLPDWLAVTWGAVLVAGAITALTGSYWPRKGYATALTIERVGLLLVGAAAFVYGVIIIGYVGTAGSVAGLITLGFGAAALKRSHDIRKIFTRAIHEVNDDPLPRVDREDE